MKSDGMMSMKMPQTLKNKAVNLASDQDLTLSKFVVRLIEREVSRVERLNARRPIGYKR